MTDLNQGQERCIPITGGIACGKSTVGSFIKEMGYLVLDADSFAQEALQPKSTGLKSVADIFGETILTADGKLHRKKAADIIFNDMNKKKIFENIVHPIINRLLSEAINRHKEKTYPFWFYEIPLLFEKKLHLEYQRIWVVDCPSHIQVTRITNRDNRELTMIERIIANQIPQDEKKSLASTVIDTNCSKIELKQRIVSAIALEKDYFRKFYAK